MWRPGGKPGSRPPRRAPPSAKSVLRGAVLVGLAGLSALGVVQGASWLKRSDALPVRSVAVRGTSPERAAEISSYAAVTPGEPVFSIDLAAVAARVGEHPYVKDASVRVVPPDGLEIVVEERVAKAILSVGELYLVDDRGTPFKSARPGDGLDLPVITGLDEDDVVGRGGQGTDGADGRARVREALALLEEHERQGGPGGPVSEVVVVPGVGLDVVFTSGLRARIGRGEVPGKLGRLAQVLNKLETEKLQASFVYLDDARRPERVAVRLRVDPERTSTSGT